MGLLVSSVVTMTKPPKIPGYGASDGDLGDVLLCGSAANLSPPPLSPWMEAASPSC